MINTPPSVIPLNVYAVATLELTPKGKEASDVVVV